MEMGWSHDADGHLKMDTTDHHVGPKNWMEEYRQTKNEMGGSLQKCSRSSMVQNSKGQRMVETSGLPVAASTPTYRARTTCQQEEQTATVESKKQLVNSASAFTTCRYSRLAHLMNEKLSNSL